MHCVMSQPIKISEEITAVKTSAPKKALERVSFTPDRIAYPDLDENCEFYENCENSQRCEETQMWSQRGLNKIYKIRKPAGDWWNSKTKKCRILKSRTAVTKNRFENQKRKFVKIVTFVEFLWSTGNLLLDHPLFLLYCKRPSKLLTLFLLISNTGQRTSNDGSISSQQFVGHHVIFADFTADRLVLCRKQQQRQTKWQHSEFIVFNYSYSVSFFRKCPIA